MVKIEREVKRRHLYISDQSYQIRTEISTRQNVLEPEPRGCRSTIRSRAGSFWGRGSARQTCGSDGWRSRRSAGPPKQNISWWNTTPGYYLTRESTPPFLRTSTFSTITHKTTSPRAFQSENPISPSFRLRKWFFPFSPETLTFASYTLLALIICPSEYILLFSLPFYSDLFSSFFFFC